MAKVQKTNNMAFKMKRSPAKNLGDFFGSIFSGKAVKGRQDAQRKRNTGEYEGMTDFEKRRAEKKSRKPGESKFQADVRRKREAKRAKRAETKRRENDPLLEEIKDTSELQGPKNKPTTKTVTTPKAKQTFKQAFAAARKANKKTFNFEGKSYTTKLKEEIKQPKSTQTSGYFQGDPEQPNFGATFINPINKKNMRNTFKMKGPSLFKLKKSPAKNTKGGLEQKHPTKGNVTGADYEMIRSSDKDKKSYAIGYNVMTKAQKKKHGKPIDGEYVISKSGHIKRIG